MMRWTCAVHTEKIKMHIKVWLENLKEGDYLEENIKMDLK
jgi:hypothetical protein